MKLSKSGFHAKGAKLSLENAKIKSLWKFDLRFLRILCAFSVKPSKAICLNTFITTER